MTDKLLKYKYTDPQKAAFWARIEQRLKILDSNASDLADHCGFDFLAILDQDFHSIATHLPVIAQSMGCSLHWLVYGSGLEEDGYRPAMDDVVSILFKDGSAGTFTLLGIEASAYLLQYYHSNEDITVPKKAIAHMSLRKDTHKNVCLVHQGNTHTITLRGRFDESSSNEWNAAITHLREQIPHIVCVDCSELVSISSVGIGFFISAYKIAKNNGFSFSLYNVDGHTLRALKDCKIDEMLIGHLQ